MKQLTIKEIAPYLPYKVKIMLNRPEFKGIYTEYELRNYSDYTISINFNNGNKYGAMPSEIKPILRPLSDLTKEIEHNGERFVPIVKLLDLLDESDYIDYIIEGGKFYDYKLQVDDDWNHCVQFNNDDVCLCFSYDSNTNSFMLSTNINGIEWCTISNQLELFQKLHEWHFDLYSLLENNLAINLNTL